MTVRRAHDAARRPPAIAGAHRLNAVSIRHAARSAATVEIFFTTLLVVVFLLITWFAGFVVVKLFKGQTR
jgi:hypothetical protein